MDDRKRIANRNTRTRYHERRRKEKQASVDITTIQGAISIALFFFFMSMRVIKGDITGTINTYTRHTLSQHITWQYAYSTVHTTITKVPAMKVWVDHLLGTQSHEDSSSLEINDEPTIVPIVHPTVDFETYEATPSILQEEEQVPEEEKKL